MEPRVSTFHKASILRIAWTTIHELSTFMTHLRAQRLTRHKKKRSNIQGARIPGTKTNHLDRFLMFRC